MHVAVIVRGFLLVFHWRAEGWANGATASGIEGRGHPKSEITKITFY